MAYVTGDNPSIIQNLNEGINKELKHYITFEVAVGFNFFGSENRASVWVDGTYSAEPSIDMAGSGCKIKVEDTSGNGGATGSPELFLRVNCGSTKGLDAIVTIYYDPSNSS